MTNISVFSFEDCEVRFVGTAEKPEWVAADVCKILGLNTSEAVNGHKRNKPDGTVYYDGGLDQDEKGMVILHTPGGEQEVLTVTEPGLYRLIFKSRKPVAKRFQRWVFHDVLPSIRQTGNYAVSDPSATPSTTPPNSDTLLSLQDQLAVLSYVFDGFINAGVDRKLVESAKIGAIAAQFPTMTPALESAKHALMLQTPDSGRRYSPTELGKMLAAQLGREKPIRAADINQALKQAGLQACEHHTNAKGEKKTTWHLTPDGEKYGRVFLESAQGHSKTVPVIRWLPAILEAIAAQFTD